MQKCPCGHVGQVICWSFELKHSPLKSSMNKEDLPNLYGVLCLWNGAKSGFMSRGMSVACNIRTASYETVRFIASYCGLVKVRTILSG